MTAPHFDIESHHATATLYLRRPLAKSDVRDFRIACALLPAGVWHLRIDARALRDADQGTRRVLRELVRHWRGTRGGGVELYWSERMLGMAPGCPSPTIQPALLTVHENAALARGAR